MESYQKHISSRHYATFSLEEAAQFLGIHKETIRKRAVSGELPGAKIGKSWRFLEIDLVAYLRSFYSNEASQGVHFRRNQRWHSISEKTCIGLTSVTTEEEYRKALGLAIN